MGSKSLILGKRGVYKYPNSPFVSFITHNNENKLAKNLSSLTLSFLKTMDVTHLILVSLLICSHVCAETNENPEIKKTYIVHMDRSYMPTTFDDHQQWFYSSLKTASNSAEILYTYQHAVHGYATRLSPTELKSLESQPGVVLVNEEVVYQLHTTRSPSFLGLDRSESLIPTSTTGGDVIIGVLDTGVWPESKSYDDTGLGPIPSSWKGICESSKSFSSSSCNNKLIGARFFLKGYESAYGPVDEATESRSPRDDDGHGTHTSTTAGGSAVAGASLLGYAQGTARGMAQYARLAAYKVCWLGGCFGSDIVAAMEAAITDGVHILSMSLGGSTADYYRDTVAIGAFRAMSHGIFVSCSAGNSGPSTYSLSNAAPWISTVGAGTLDRDFPAYIRLQNGKNFSGVSLYSGTSLPNKLSPIVFAGNVSKTSSGDLCLGGTLDPEKVAGKIVVCDRGMNSRAAKGVEVKEAGGVGMILSNTDLFGEELVADAHLIPSAAVGVTAGNTIKEYISSNANPTATIVSGVTHLNVKPSPVVAAFSSRGPNPITLEILKPDFIAPGVNILAGWTGKVGPTGMEGDKRHVDFNIISGTSMSCPHASGLAAILKAANPEWSPAAIRSALMTTAYTTYKNGQRMVDVATGMPSTPFDHGSGHVDPIAALDPGLVYDATAADYTSFLCALNYSSSQIKVVTNQDFTCDSSKKYSVTNLNYPSFAVPLQTASGRGGGSKAPTVVQYTRTLTNVGSAATYKVLVSSVSKAVKITVEPQVLTFSQRNEKKSYTVTFTASSMPSGVNSFARLQWLGGKYVVSSPIAFSWT